MKIKKIKLAILISIVTVTLVGCGKPTAESLKQDIENQKFSTVIKEYTNLESDDKTKVDEYITLSVAQLMTKYSETERTKEGKDEVIQKIDKLQGMKGASSTMKQVLEASKQVINDYYTNQDTFNKAEEISNPEDALKVYKLLQESCKEDPKLLEKVNTKVNDTSSKLTKEIKKGSKINAGGFSITFNKFEFSYDVLPKNTNGFYTHYQADKGKVYYHVAMDLKNNNKQHINGDKLLNAELVYDNDYKYSGFIALDKTDGSGFDYANITSIQPLETRGVRLLFDIPQEIEKSKGPIKINIEIDGKKFVYKVR